MIDWNGNGTTDDDDHAFTALVIDQTNREAERDKAINGFPDEEDDFYLDDEEE